MDGILEFARTPTVMGAGALGFTVGAALAFYALYRVRRLPRDTQEIPPDIKVVLLGGVVIFALGGSVLALAVI